MVCSDSEKWFIADANYRAQHEISVQRGWSLNYWIGMTRLGLSGVGDNQLDYLLIQQKFKQFDWVMTNIHHLVSLIETVKHSAGRKHQKKFLKESKFDFAPNFFINLHMKHDSVWFLIPDWASHHPIYRRWCVSIDAKHYNSNYVSDFPTRKLAGCCRESRSNFHSRTLRKLLSVDNGGRRYTWSSIVVHVI